MVYHTMYMLNKSVKINWVNFDTKHFPSFAENRSIGRRNNYYYTCYTRGGGGGRPLYRSLPRNLIHIFGQNGSWMIKLLACLSVHVLVCNNLCAQMAQFTAWPNCQIGAERSLRHIAETGTWDLIWLFVAECDIPAASLLISASLKIESTVVGSRKRRRREANDLQEIIGLRFPTLVAHWNSVAVGN